MLKWNPISLNQPHLIYLLLGAFTSLFMLFSIIIKERLYIGEATVATIFGIIFGPHGTNAINPLKWHNHNWITLEFSRIVLVVQCFAVGVELPPRYILLNWRSMAILLGPVMAVGWIVTSLFVWLLFSSHLSWLDSLCISACVTATDPVLASSVVGKGKFSKRVPRHMRDLLSAESGSNDGMAFPFLYLSLFLIRYHSLRAYRIASHWLGMTILYECIGGTLYGFSVGFLARHTIRYAHEHRLMNRESFLAFYFVLALFCAGSASTLGFDDMLVGFAAGLGFSNDGWFQAETEESSVSNVIDLLLNLSFFVYFGTIIPWTEYRSPHTLGTNAWRLVLLGAAVLLFRRMPIILALWPFIPNIKTWQEALFAGHFGPIGVGALFTAILARTELQPDRSIPIEQSENQIPHLNIIQMIWPLTTFLVIVSIVVHGSSIAVFMLGRRINNISMNISNSQLVTLHQNPNPNNSSIPVAVRRGNLRSSTATEIMDHFVNSVVTNFVSTHTAKNKNSVSSSINTKTIGTSLENYKKGEPQCHRNTNQGITGPRLSSTFFLRGPLSSIFALDIKDKEAARTVPSAPDDDPHFKELGSNEIHSTSSSQISPLTLAPPNENDNFVQAETVERGCRPHVDFRIVEEKDAKETDILNIQKPARSRSGSFKKNLYSAVVGWVRKHHIGKVRQLDFQDEKEKNSPILEGPDNDLEEIKENAKK